MQTKQTRISNGGNHTEMPDETHPTISFYCTRITSDRIVKASGSFRSESNKESLLIEKCVFFFSLKKKNK